MWELRRERGKSMMKTERKKNIYLYVYTGVYTADARQSLIAASTELHTLSSAALHTLSIFVV